MEQVANKNEPSLQEVFSHFRERAYERYGVDITYTDWLTIKNSISNRNNKNPLASVEFIENRGDIGELWYVCLSGLSAALFVVFSKSNPVTVLPDQDCRPRLNRIRKRRAKDKTAPDAENHYANINDFNDPHYKQCVMRLFDYYKIIMTKEMWNKWHNDLKNHNSIVVCSKNDIMRIVEQGRNIYIQSRKGKILNVIEPLPLWDKKLSEALKGRGSNLLAEAMKRNFQV